MREKFKVCLPIVCALPMLVVMAMIFYYSSQVGEVSSQTSNQAGEILGSILGVEVPPGNASQTQILLGLDVRKSAHVFLFSLLGLTSFGFFASVFGVFGKNCALLTPLKVFACSVLLSAVYACLDEWHQSFVDGRAGLVSDVAIDAIGFVGAAVACVLLWYVIRGICALIRRCQ